VFWLLWGGYASYYLCRVNFAVAQPAILGEFKDWTSAQVGAIPSVYQMFYAAGQVINGVLGQRLGTRRMMTAALLTAAATNLLFSFASNYPVMLALWALNGFAQSAGWSLLVQTLSNWNTSQRRGTLIGAISTCYQIGNAASWVLAGQLCQTVGWRAAFWVPSLILLPMAFVFYVFLRDTPEEVGFPTVRDDGIEAKPLRQATAAQSTGAGPAQGTLAIVRMTLANRILWVLCIGFFCMNSVRYTFLNWTVQYMHDFHGRTIKGSAFMAIIFPLIGCAGALVAGWASDTLFGKRRAPVCAIMLLGMATACGLFTIIPQGQWLVATALLGLAGFLIYGPDMLMSGAATVDVSHPRAASIATGLTMSMGATGAIFSGAGIGWLKDVSQGHWAPVFWLLAALSTVSALLMVSIWNARPKGAK
jgi:sugar phosphate permease